VTRPPVRYSRIAGTGSALPGWRVGNDWFEARLDTTDEWIRARTGIEQRFWLREDQRLLDLCEQAALASLEAAGLAAHALDLIVLATTTPEQVFPSMACLLQERVGAGICPAFDVQAVCTGFIYALTVADQFIRTGSARRVLVVGAEALSRIVDLNDRGTCVLFGDGAGAVVLEASEQPGILATRLHADGRFAELLQVPGGPGQVPSRLDEASRFIQMRGSEVFKLAVATLERLVDETLADAGMTQGEIDWLVPHQANQRIIAATARKLELPLERVVLTVAEHGNTSAASIPLALDVAVRDGRIRRGETLLMEAFGGGLTWGSVLARY